MRVLHRPSTAATLHVAVVAAQSARLLRDDDEAYAQRLLTAALTAYRAAYAYPDLIVPDDGGRYGGGPYGTHGWSTTSTGRTSNCGWRPASTGTAAR
jgi:hypothetical protein